MCECGCVGNDDRYWFPAPNRQIYVLSLHGGCTNCDSPPGFTIERVDKPKADRKDEFFEHYLDGELKFSKWPDTHGAAVITGFCRYEFVKAMLPHLVGVDSSDLGEDGLLDEAGSEVILDEAYEDAMFKPKLVAHAAR